MTEKKLLFSVTKDDCDWSTMTASGPGGQHRNRSQTAVRCVHRASGAVGEASDNKSQLTNKRAAFERMVASKTFKNWHRMETARRMVGAQSIEAMVDKAVDEAMNPANIKVEVQNERGQWVSA
jgi:protein subunit release factor B